MYRSYYCILMILILNGCATINSDGLFRNPLASSETPPSFQSEKQALFDQPFIDPLTDYLIEHQGDPARETVLPQIRQERNQRCAAVAEQYADEPASEAVLARYNLGYGYSCPQDVAAFERRLERQLDQAAPEPEPEPEAEPALTDPVPADKPQVSDQALSDCYLLTTIRNFSAAREACREPAENGDLRSQENMATVAYAFEDYNDALKWARMAAPESSEAAFLMGQMYAAGHGVSQNRDRAVYWYNKAAAKGHQEAQTVLDRDREVDAPGGS